MTCFPVPLRRLLLLVLAAMPLLALAADAGDIKSYALRTPVAVAPGAPLQRLALPVEALVQLQVPGYADLRIFNAQGQPVPMALANVAPPIRAEQTVQLVAYPILGAAAAGAGGLDGLSLRIEEQQGRRVVQLNTPAGSAGQLPARQNVLGALLDARAVKTPVARMALDVDLPAGQPVTFSVHVSLDLTNWRPLASTVLYRADAAGGTAGAPDPAGELGQRTLDLPLADLTGQYLRITWGSAAVTLRGATLSTSRTGTAQRVTAAMARPVLSTPHALGFALPFATPVAAMQITAQGSNVLVPVRVLGRNDRSQPWTVLASTVVYRLSSPASSGQPAEQVNGPVELHGTSMREIRIEADAKTAGFAAAPDVALQFSPARVVFLASGPAPFMLAAGFGGSAGPVSPYLPIASLIPGYQPGQENTLPLAQADMLQMAGPSATSGGLVIGQPASSGLPTRTLLLWESC